MNATAAIAQAFLNGEILSIKTAFRDFGITNLPRECGRSIERKFGVKLARVRQREKAGSRFTPHGMNTDCQEFRIIPKVEKR